jgi:hypothetical protein
VIHLGHQPFELGEIALTEHRRGDPHGDRRRHDATGAGSAVASSDGNRTDWSSVKFSTSPCIAMLVMRGAKAAARRRRGG